MARPNANNIRPASEDPLGDPADTEQGILPASQDPLGDPADQQDAAQGIRPASEDPLGDPAFQDFAGRFGNSDFSDEEAAQYYDRFQGHEQHDSAQSDYLSQMPPEEFEQSAHQAAYQMPPQQRQEVAGGLLGALQGRGFDIGQVASALGLGSTSPQQMGPQDLGRLLGWTQQNAPDALHETMQNKPWFVQAMGSPVVRGILQNLAQRFLNR